MLKEIVDRVIDTLARVIHVNEDKAIQMVRVFELRKVDGVQANSIRVSSTK